jgi:hypothetical protein
MIASTAVPQTAEHAGSASLGRQLLPALRAAGENLTQLIERLAVKLSRWP